MMKMNKRTLALLLCALLFTVILPVQASAAGSVDLGRAPVLTVSYLDESTPLVGASFKIYLVATMDEVGELTPTAEFSEFNVDIRGENESAWRTLASTLQGYVQRDNLTPAASGVTDDAGQLVMPEDGKTLNQGLYLVLGQDHTQGGRIYFTEPFFVTLPGLNREANEWDYDLVISPKCSSRPVPDDDDTITLKALKVWKDEGFVDERPDEITVQLLCDGKVYDSVALSKSNNWRYTWSDLSDGSRWTLTEDTPEGYTVTVVKEGITFVVTNTYAEEDVPSEPTEPSGPSLPQTGQLWWPVPLLIFAGLAFVTVGLIFRKDTEQE